MSATTTTLTRSLGPIGVALLTLSVLSPAASVFVAGADIVHQAGSGAALAFLLGGIVTLIFTFGQAEIGSAFPIAGGNYASCGQILGPRLGFMQFALGLLSVPVFAAITATGIATYLHVVAPGLATVPTAIAALIIATGVATLNIRTNAVITGIFLAIELGALVLVAALGFFHPARGIGQVLLHPGGATAAPLTLGVLGLAVASASWATSGAGQAMYFSEELHDPVRVGRLVMQICVIAVATMFFPVLGMMAGAGDLPGIVHADAPFASFVSGAAAPWLATALSLAVAAAIFNACTAGVLCYGRWLYCSGRDDIWPRPVSVALTRVHPRFGSPWVATLVIGALGVGFCFLGLRTLIILAAATGIFDWTFINSAALIGRRRGLTGQAGRYRAPFGPLLPLLSLGFCAALAWLALTDADAGRPGMIVVAATLAAGWLYHRFVLARRPGGFALVNPNVVQPA